MGSEGYLINEFVAPRTNHRSDEWGGAFENRIRFPVEIVRRTREAVGPNFIIIFRLSMLDLVDGRQHVGGGRRAGQGGRGGGRHDHQHRHRLARGARADDRDDGAARRVRVGDEAAEERSRDSARSPPTGSTIPAVAEAVLARGDGDMVSMARPFLADAEFVNKAAAGRADEINTCIACNQACLDQIFSRQIASCLVNPRACHETKIVMKPAAQEEAHRRRRRRPGGPRLRDHGRGSRPRGHAVRCRRRDRRPVQSGAPDSRARRSSPRRCGITAAASSAPVSRCTSSRRVERGRSRGLRPCRARDRHRPAHCRRFPASIIRRSPAMPTSCMGRRVAGKRVAIIGAGGIGFDVGEFLTHHGGHDETDEYFAEWGIDPQYRERGGIRPADERAAAARSLAAAAQGEQGRRRPREDHRLDPPHAAQEARREDDSRRRVRADRRRGTAHPRGRQAAAARRRHDRRLRRAGAAPRAARCRCRRRDARSR